MERIEREDSMANIIVLGDRHRRERTAATRFKLGDNSNRPESCDRFNLDTIIEQQVS